MSLLSKKESRQILSSVAERVKNDEYRVKKTSDTDEISIIVDGSELVLNYFTYIGTIWLFVDAYKENISARISNRDDKVYIYLNINDEKMRNKAIYLYHKAKAKHRNNSKIRAKRIAERFLATVKKSPEDKVENVN